MTPAPEEPVPPVQLGIALGAIWERFRETMAARVEVLERTAAALGEGGLDEELRRSAEREAHKLAGALGSFGLAEGSRLAREAEELLGAVAPPAAADAPRLARLAAGLRADVDRPFPG